MRKITHIVVHCSATVQTATVEAIQKYWREQLGWKQPGYHRICKADGTLVKLLDYESVSNGVAGHNSSIINICYIGGIDSHGVPADNRTPAQKATLEKELRSLKAIHKDALIVGHRDFPGVHKACPSFDAKKEYALIK
jgi:N-acetylmuramoyl-L-alanine amidase